MGEKDHDKWVRPACRMHHTAYHALGHAEFERRYRIDTRKIAEEMARTSPHRHRWAEERIR